MRTRIAAVVVALLAVSPATGRVRLFFVGCYLHQP